MPHLQATIPFMVDSSVVIVTHNVSEGVAPAPLSSVTSDISLHGVVIREVIPRTHQLYGFHGRVSLTEVGFLSARCFSKAG
jgi:hypothetical protein